MKAEEKKDIFYRLAWMDRRILYWILVVCLIVPYFYPLGLPLGIGASTKKAYNAVNSVRSGAIALVEPASPGYWPETGGGGLAICKDLLRNGVKLIFWTGMETSAPMCEYLIKRLSKELEGKTYGVDYVNIGFVPGAEAAYAALANDFQGAVKNDYRGNSVKDLPLVANVRGAIDIAFVTDMSGGSTPHYYVRHWYTPYKTRYVTACTALMYPTYNPYQAAGQIAGMLAGVRGGAEYELLSKSPGEAIASMDSMSVSHLLILAFVVLGNMADIKKRLDEKKLKKSEEKK